LGPPPGNAVRPIPLPCMLQIERFLVTRICIRMWRSTYKWLFQCSSSLNRVTLHGTPSLTDYDPVAPCLQPLQSDKAKFREGRHLPSFATIHSEKLQKWKPTFVLHSHRSLPSQWECQSSWHQWGLKSIPWLSRPKTEFSVFGSSNHRPERRKWPCGSS
jgi:hypothetical protein